MYIKRPLCPLTIIYIKRPLFSLLYYTKGKPGSSVSIVSGYGLEDLTIEVRSPAEAEDFSSSLCGPPSLLNNG
jgi:hypothetical protein